MNSVYYFCRNQTPEIMNLKSSKYPILKAFAPVYEKRVFLNTMIQTQQNCMDKLQLVEEFLRNIVSESDFSMCVPADVFDKIVESDFIKNSIETGQRGSTMGGPEVRIKALKISMALTLTALRQRSSRNTESLQERTNYPTWPATLTFSGITAPSCSISRRRASWTVPLSQWEAASISTSR